MGQLQTLLLGFVAGVTILLGLPFGRLRNPRIEIRVFLNALAIGVLVFLLWDVLAHAWEPLDAALSNQHAGTGGFGPILGYGMLFLGGLLVGLMSLVFYEGWFHRGPAQIETAGDGSGMLLPSSAQSLALLIAVGIGLHNFGEGLAIGGSAAQGEVNLVTLLVIGFALHNGTEGFGIVAPLAAAGERPSWRFLLMLGAIGGGPTFVGTVVGRQFTSDALSVLFLTLAAGSILYVVVQLLGIALRANRANLLYWGLFAGLAAGFITDMVVTAAGA
jgi:ZIP family zinc transporter